MGSNRIRYKEEHISLELSPSRRIVRYLENPNYFTAHTPKILNHSTRYARQRSKQHPFPP